MAVLPLAQFSSNPHLGSFSGMVRAEDSTGERAVLALARCLGVGCCSGEFSPHPQDSELVSS